MKGNERDWWDSPEDDEWVWFGGHEDGLDQPKNLLKLKTFAVQFKTNEGMKSVEIDGISERDAIQQLTEEFQATDPFEIISVIEVDYDE